MSEISEEKILTGVDFDSTLNKFSAYFYTIKNGKEIIDTTTAYMFDDKETALEYIKNIAFYKKRKDGKHP